MKLSRNGCLGIAGVVVLLIVVAVVAVYGYFNGLQQTAVSKHTGLNAQYQDNQNYLSSYISGFYEMAGIPQAQGDQLATILSEAVKGRYDEDGFGSGSPLFVAISEAYPDLSQLSVGWNKIQDYIQGGREGYRNVQSKLLDMLRDYDLWRQSGLIQSAFIRMMGYPDNTLVARIGTDVVYGQAALDRMRTIVLTQEAINAYQTGVMDPLQVPGAPARPTEAK